MVMRIILVEMNEDTHDADEVDNDVVCKQASSFSSKSQVRAHLLFADCIWTVLTEMPSTQSQF